MPQTPRVLVLNAGSSSLKFGLFAADDLRVLASGLVDWTADPGRADLRVRHEDGAEVRSQLPIAGHQHAVADAVRLLAKSEAIPPHDSALAAVGHRVVQGGTVFRESVRIRPEVTARLAELVDLAPLHNPPALEAIETAEAAFPGVPHVAVFDTMFFTRLPPAAYLYPLPYAWYADWGVRRFGFHGISHAYCAGRAAELLGRDPRGLRLVICHLGNGCSATAVCGGVAVATSMGFTPLEGLMMGTRSGSVDPGVLLYVLRHRGLTADQLDDALNHRSGLLGVSGVSSDFRAVETAAREGNDRARLALEIYARRVRSTIGALSAEQGGLDALVFTAGVGEHSASLRAAACGGLECLGVVLDAARNTACEPDADIATPASTVRILVIHTQEELLIAREARRVASETGERG